MRRDTPPRWMERMLLLFLPGHQRESVSGDLLEEFRQERLPRLGLAGADSWYLRQIVSIALIRMAGGLLMRGMLVCLCAFNVAAGAWLGFMEQVLRHNGYGGRTAIAVCITLQALATIAVVLLKPSLPLRQVVGVGAAAIVALGGFAVYRIATAQHFEGFVLIIGAALILQGMFTLMTLLPGRYLHAS